jgi:hypothetical protein
MLLTIHPYRDYHFNMRTNKDAIKQMSLYIPRALAERVKQNAQKNRRSFNQQIVWLVEQTLAIHTNEKEYPNG